MKHWLKPLVLATALAAFAPAHAAVYHIDFTATGLRPINGQIPWTSGPLSGSFNFSFRPSPELFLDINAVNFKVAGDAYAVSEVGGIRWPMAYLFGGLTDTIFVGGYGKDFTLIAEDTGQGRLFVGNSSQPDEYWVSSDVSFHISEVPEPGTAALLLAGCAAAAGLRRRRTA